MKRRTVEGITFVLWLSTILRASKSSPCSSWAPSLWPCSYSSRFTVFLLSQLGKSGGDPNAVRKKEFGGEFQSQVRRTRTGFCFAITGIRNWRIQISLVQHFIRLESYMPPTSRVHSKYIPSTSKATSQAVFDDRRVNYEKERRRASKSKNIENTFSCQNAHACQQKWLGMYLGM